MTATNITLIRKIFLWILLGVVMITDYALAWNTPISTPLGTKYTKWTWTGATDSDWNKPGNWCGSYLNGACQGAATAPTAGAFVVFDNTCITCTVNMPGGAVGVSGMQVLPNFVGTINQNATALTLKAGGFTFGGGTYNQGTGTFTVIPAAGTQVPDFRMTGGTFNGGNADITIGVSTSSTNGLFSITGGTFKSTSATLRIYVYTIVMTGLTGFTHNSGTVYITAPGGNLTMTVDSATYIFNDFKFDGASGRNLTFNGTITMDGNLIGQATGSGRISVTGGTFDLRQGNFTHSFGVQGNTKIKFTGTTEQLFTGPVAGVGADQFVPGIEIASASGTGSVKFVGSPTITGGFIYNNTLGGISLNGQTFKFSTPSSSNCSKTTCIFDTPLATFVNLEVDYNPSSQSIVTVNVSANLTISSTTNNASTADTGAINVGGDIIMASGATQMLTTTLLVLNGAGVQNVDVSASSLKKLPGLKIDKPSGSVTFTGDPKIYADFNYASNTIPVTVPAAIYFFGSGGFLTSNGLVFNDVHLEGGNAVFDWVDTMKVSGNFYMDIAGSCRMRGSTIEVTGDVISTVTGGCSSTNTALVKLVGVNQTIDYTLPSSFPRLEISSSGAVKFLGTIYVRGITYVWNGTGALDAGTSSLIMDGSGGGVTPGGQVYYNFSYATTNSLSISGSTLDVRGDLSLNASSAGRTLTGNVDVYGNVNFPGFGLAGTGTLNLKGNDSTITRASGAAITTGLITVAKTAGQKVSLNGNVALASGSSMSVTSGSVTVGTGNTLTISGGGSLTLSATTFIKLSSGLLSIGGANVTAPQAYSGGNIIN